MSTIQISRLPHAERCGDWHDKPLKWIVNGPGKEAQKFSTKVEAAIYKRVRKTAPDVNAAINAFIAATP